MNDSIISIDDLGTISVDADNEYVINMFLIAGEGIVDTTSFITRQSVIGEVEALLNNIKKSPNKKARAFHDTFNGAISSQHRMMVWDLAWAVYRSTTGWPVILNQFFTGIDGGLLNIFRNHPRLATYIYNNINKHLLTPTATDPSDPKSVIKQIENTTAFCNKKVQTCKRNIAGYLEEIKSMDTTMQDVYQSAIEQITKDAKETITDLSDKLEKTNKELEKTKAALTKAEAELKEQKSKEHQKEVGEQYLIQVFDRYIAKYEKSNDLQLRKEKYHELWPFVSSVKAIPEIIKERVAALEFAREDELEKERKAALSTQGDNNGIMAQVVNVNMGQPSIPTSNRDRHTLTDSVINYINRSFSDDDNN